MPDEDNKKLLDRLMAMANGSVAAQSGPKLEIDINISIKNLLDPCIPEIIKNIKKTILENPQLVKINFKLESTDNISKEKETKIVSFFENLFSNIISDSTIKNSKVLLDFSAVHQNHAFNNCNHSPQSVDVPVI